MPRTEWGLTRNAELCEQTRAFRRPDRNVDFGERVIGRIGRERDRIADHARLGGACVASASSNRVE